MTDKKRALIVLAQQLIAADNAKDSPATKRLRAEAVARLPQGEYSLALLLMVGTD